MTQAGHGPLASGIRGLDLPAARGNWRAWMAGQEDSTAARLVSGNQRNRGARCSGICATGGLKPWR